MQRVDDPPFPQPVKLKHRLGAGSVGEVWLAEDASDRSVAIKFIRIGRAGRVPEREFAALKLNAKQPEDGNGLVRVLHVGQSEDWLWYTMELADLEGDPPMPRTLAHEIGTQGRLGGLDALTIAERLARALGALHDAGVIHRDVKPANILSVGGVWKLGDIGLLAEERTEMTAVGTPDFIPPWGPIDRRADLYALGRVLYCMVTGKPARSFPTLPPELLTTEQQRESKLLNRLITKACDPDPDARFQSAEEFIAAIERTRAGIEGAGSQSRRRVLLALGGVGVVAAFGGAPWAIGRWKKASGPSQAWIPLFDGVSLDGWKIIYQNASDPWWVEDGSIVAREDEEFKSLDCLRTVGFGRFRATVTPSCDRGRLGLSYGQPAASFFLFYEDKYVWIRRYKEPDAPESLGRWRSFPGPVIPRAGESITMEVDWDPLRTLLLVNGEVVQEVDGHPDGERVGLHVWGGDGGAYQDLEFLPRS